MTSHPTLLEISRYAEADATLDEASVWSIEVHLETCADCRARLAGSTTDESRGMIARVGATLGEEIATGPAPAGRPLRTPRRWFVTALLPWVTMTVAVIGAASVLTRLLPQLPSVVLLLAPLAPLPGVAAAWSRRADPAWELISSTPVTGLTMLLRRTAAVLILVIPALAIAGRSQGLALVLLPCLAFTAATLLLGSAVGVQRAAIGLVVAWTLAVVAPSLVRADLPVLLEPSSAPVWALLTVVLTALTFLRAPSFRRLTTF
ncbi:MAG: zf-HC2 domain-containing protein [Actinomycetota bacterium]|nr:zf-HC2 domain-containing protein [Actinomycetota bacterium]